MNPVHNGPNLKGLVTALKTLTALRLPWKDSEGLADSLPWFPIVGILLGIILYALGLLWHLLPTEDWPPGIALLITAAEVALTRGLHLDGLADWADSIGGLFQRERRLAIMKDSSLGAFGVLALGLSLLAMWVIFERLYRFQTLIWVIPVFALSRNSMVGLMISLPYARSGEGMAKDFIMGASLRHKAFSFFISAVICLLFGPFGIVLLGISSILQNLFRARFRKQFGGITGDLLGTANQISEMVLLGICALLGSRLLTFTGWTWVLSFLSNSS